MDDRADEVTLDSARLTHRPTMTLEMNPTSQVTLKVLQAVLTDFESTEDEGLSYFNV
jgi:hypothetical protein